MSMLTVRAAAIELGVAYSTLKRWLRSGRVRTTRTEGGHHRIARTEVDRLLATHPQSPAVARRTGSADATELLELSARNRLPGVVEEVRVDGLLAQVRLQVAGHQLTAVVTADAVRALGLRRGDEALAVIKSTEVMLAKPARSGTQRVAERPRSRQRSR